MVGGHLGVPGLHVLVIVVGVFKEDPEHVVIHHLSTVVHPVKEDPCRVSIAPTYAQVREDPRRVSIAPTYAQVREDP